MAHFTKPFQGAEVFDARWELVGGCPATARRDSGAVTGNERDPRGKTVLLVGAGTRMLSAMSYYTIRLTNALGQRFKVIHIPMRQLIPSFLYPGRSRVGTATTSLKYDDAVTVLPGIDWYAFPNLFRDLRYIWKHRPDVVIFEWWTGSVLHNYLPIAALCRMTGTRIIVEIHEILDTGEARIPFARAWVSVLGRPFFRVADGFVIHSEFDRAPLHDRYRLGDRPCVVIPLGPMNHHAAGDEQAPVRKCPPEGVVNILFFGIIRPYKGLEDLIRAFDMLSDDEVQSYWLTIVGETWEGWDLPTKLVNASPHRDRITFINRFVDDEEVVAQFASADAVVLPYLRSSASSPAHVAMSNGLPLVITNVGGLPEAVADYEGAMLVPPSSPKDILAALRKLPSMHGKRFEDPHSWSNTVARYEDLIDVVEKTASRR